MPSAIITMDGHILDSLLLPKVLDLIVAANAEYEIEQITIGRTRHDHSFARIRIDTADDATLGVLLTQSLQHGALLLT
jgi:hypothetical protein